MNMVKRNHTKGFGYEHRFVKKLLKEGARRAIRHYGSRGVTDIEWTNQRGFKHEAQLKFSSIKLPKISGKERVRIQEYAKTKKGVTIWIVCKLSRGPETWEVIH